MVLMILRHIWGWNQYRRAPLCLQFTERNRTGTADHKICGCQAVRHIVDVLADVHIGVPGNIQTFFFEEIGEPFPPLAVGVNVLELVRTGAPNQKIGNCFIDLSGAQTSTKGQDQRPLIQPQFLARIGTPGADDLLSHGISRQHTAGPLGPDAAVRPPPPT